VCGSTQIVWLGLSNYWTIAEIIIYASYQIFSHLKCLWYPEWNSR